MSNDNKPKKTLTKTEAAMKIEKILAQLPDEATRRDVLAFLGAQ